MMKLSSLSLFINSRTMPFILLFYIQIIFQLFFIQTMIIIPTVHARMGLMNKLRILALLSLVKKIDVVPFPFPIPIPIHIDGKEEIVFMNSMPSNGHLSQPSYSTSSLSSSSSSGYGYSASELSPVSISPNNGNHLRYGDRISTNNRPALGNHPGQTTTYRMRKEFRHRQPPQWYREINKNQNKQTTDAKSLDQSSSTTIVQDPNADNVNLKDIKIIFIPIKNLQQQMNQQQNGNPNTETMIIESDMKQLTDEIKEQLKSNNNQPKTIIDKPNTDNRTTMDPSTTVTTMPPTTSTVSVNKTETEAPIITDKQIVSSPKSIDAEEIMIDDHDDDYERRQLPPSSSSSSKNVVENQYTVDAPSIDKTSKPETFTKFVRMNQPTTPTIYQLPPPPPTTETPTYQASSAPFPIPSLESEWLKQNSYVPRARYYKAPELKILHHLKSNQDEQHHQYLPPSSHSSSLPQPPSITNQWSSSGPQTDPSHPIQFLYSVSHANNVPVPSFPTISPSSPSSSSSASLNYNSLTLQRPHIQPLQIQSSMARFHRYPIVDNFGLEAFHRHRHQQQQQQQYRRRPLMMSQRHPLIIKNNAIDDIQQWPITSTWTQRMQPSSSSSSTSSSSSSLLSRFSKRLWG
ncbi:uncharacterized protein LOC124494434 [Dermatophagoides farinae]|uniref:uncharacterized protein LOC124494434 n=1 Tax=Dermatophagoides farinae TaxID=6954 RepID=UPI003F62AB60